MNFPRIKSFIKKSNYKRRILLVRLRCVKRLIRQKIWIRKIIRSKVLVLGPLLLSNYFLHQERQKREKAEILASLYVSQAQSTVKTFDAIYVSYLEKKKVGDRFINIGSNDYYEEQLLSSLNKTGLDLLGREDSKLQHFYSSSMYKIADSIAAKTGKRKWSRQWFISNHDTSKLAVFKFRRIELNRDTIVGTLCFDFEKLKHELKLKEYDNE
ncbi:hypothetical protein Phi47:1_gp11 [Cellulophaga phage phi47:1]|nr:hypothetical protein CDPG_00055 [Cellulophaga phage phi47:1]AGO47742.1 hypothetical protein Phi3ST:2_gp11 [Cellulophaga phage phi3ST:2]AGO49250.1 hypothetical protein Phi38:2_gp11 [Cellulophaga phage phi38:2]AGO49748.1 hypothetical protein Phi47:1_gp11 [Cellulophaga phage phi47:1]